MDKLRESFTFVRWRGQEADLHEPRKVFSDQVLVDSPTRLLHVRSKQRAHIRVAQLWRLRARRKVVEDEVQEREERVVLRLHDVPLQLAAPDKILASFGRVPIHSQRGEQIIERGPWVCGNMQDAEMIARLGKRRCRC